MNTMNMKLWKFPRARAGLVQFWDYRMQHNSFLQRCRNLFRHLKSWMITGAMRTLFHYSFPSRSPWMSPVRWEWDSALVTNKGCMPATCNFGTPSSLSVSGRPLSLSASHYVFPRSLLLSRSHCSPSCPLSSRLFSVSSQRRQKSDENELIYSAVIERALVLWTCGFHETSCSSSLG